MISSSNKRRRWITLAVSNILLFLGCIRSITSGEYNIPVEGFFKTLVEQGDAVDELTLLDFRLPRVVITTLTGAAFSISGAIMQGVTKDPAAEPGVLGISAGSGFVIALFIAVGKINTDNFIYVPPLVSVLGGITTISIIFIFSFNKNEGITPAGIALIGVGLQIALYGGSITIMSKFDNKQSDFIAAWFADNVWSDEWPSVIAFSPWVSTIIPYLLFKSNTLSIIHTGDSIARGLGVRLGRKRLILFFIAVMLSSAAVAVAGSISFVGLMGPHTVRRVVGPRHQLFLPTVILVGACLLIIVDTTGKTILQPGGIPAGIVVAIIDIPYFLYLMYKAKNA